MTQPSSRALGPALILVLLVLPFVATNYWLHVAIVVLMNITYTVALCAVLRMGYLSLGHAGFIALGAYTSVVLSVRFGVSPWFGIVAAAAMSGAVAWGLGALTLRLRGIYFSLAVFAFGEIVVAIARAFDWLGGPSGIANVPRPSFFGIKLDTHFAFYWLAMVVAVAVVAFFARLEQTRFGATLLTLKTESSERLAESVGVDAAAHKTACFAMSCAAVGAMGAVHSMYLLFVNPQVFSFLMSTDLVIYAMIGGTTGFWGPVLGAGVLTALGEQLFSAGYWKTLVYALILMVVILVVPGG
ncbi:MAG: branched-chain amino acid ABC transporter permease, partial [Betaproteobacteria bacterium]|nr:branched-chain amino acid ABC transporter permease [Betaproteobacteria bacterium]